MGFEKFNQPIKETCWKIIEKYDKIYLDLCNALSECIQDRINEDHLTLIRLYQFSNKLDLEDKNKLSNAMSWYYDYLVTIAFEEAYMQTEEYQQAQEFYFDKLGFL